MCCWRGGFAGFRADSWRYDHVTQRQKACPPPLLSTVVVPIAFRLHPVIASADLRCAWASPHHLHLGAMLTRTAAPLPPHPDRFNLCNAPRPPPLFLHNAHTRLPLLRTPRHVAAPRCPCPRQTLPQPVRASVPVLCHNAPLLPPTVLAQRLSQGPAPPEIRGGRLKFQRWAPEILAVGARNLSGRLKFQAAFIVRCACAHDLHAF